MSFGGGRGNGKDFNMDVLLNGEEADDGSGQTNRASHRESVNPPTMLGGNMPDISDFDPSQMPGGFDGEMPDSSDFDSSQMPDLENFDFSQMPDGILKGENNNERVDKFSFGGMGSLDVKLQYVDDNLQSYTNIWNNAKTDITTADQKRLIESLKKLSNVQELESVVDIEQVIRYFVVHNYVCNGDSYTGSMIHNYYLYEENGQMAMIPWDYNLAFGTFQGGSAQNMVNTPIDAPVSGGGGEDRPMWYWILSDRSYTELYHQYFTEFLNTVDVQRIIDNAYSLIKTYVEKDPTTFYTQEEFEAGIEAISQFCTLRSQSISIQLEEGETTANMNYADASDLNTSHMGSMGGGFGGGGMFPGGNLEGIKASSSESRQNPDFSDNRKGSLPENMQPPEGNRSHDRNTMADTSQEGNNMIWLVVSILLLILGLVTAKRYKS